MEKADYGACVAVVGEANRQEDYTSNFTLQSIGDTGDPDFHLDEGNGVVAQGLEALRVDDVRVGPCVWDSLGSDSGGSCGLANSGSEAVVIRRLLDVEARIGLVV